MYYCLYVDNVEVETDLDLDEVGDAVSEVLEDRPDAFVRIDPMIDEDEDEDEDTE